MEEGAGEPFSEAEFLPTLLGSNARVKTRDLILQGKRELLEPLQLKSDE